MRNNDEQCESSAAPEFQLPIVDEVETTAKPIEEPKLNRGPVCGVKEKSIDGLRVEIPFFASFLDNLAPRYQAPNSGGLLFEMTPSSRGRGINSAQGADKPHFDRCNESDADRGLAGSTGRPELGKGTMSRTHNTLDSSARAVLDSIMPDDIDSDELTSAYRRLIVPSSASAGGAWQGMASSKRAACGRRIHSDATNVHDKAVQCQITPKSSAGSSVPAADHTLHQFSTRGNADELKDDYRSSRLSRYKRLRLDLGYTHSAPAVLSTWRDDIDHVIRITHALQRRSERRRRRFRMTIFQALPSLSRSQEAMDRTLVTLQLWHYRLRLDNPSCPTIASSIFSRAFRIFQMSRWPQPMDETSDHIRVRVLMATAFWIAVKIFDSLKKAPKASALASAASVTPQSLILAELPLLFALQWKLVKY